MVCRLILSRSARMVGPRPNGGIDSVAPSRNVPERHGQPDALSRKCRDKNLQRLMRHLLVDTLGLLLNLSFGPPTFRTATGRDWFSIDAPAVSFLSPSAPSSMPAIATLRKSKGANARMPVMSSTASAGRDADKSVKSVDNMCRAIAETAASFRPQRA
jgi:hypothetical protein